MSKYSCPSTTWTTTHQANDWARWHASLWGFQKLEYSMINDSQSRSASMLPGAVNPVTIFFVSSNPFSVLQEIHMEGSGKVLGVSCKSRQRLAHWIRHSAALRLSSVSVSGELGSEYPFILPCLVNENHSASCIIDSGASSQFIDLDFALSLNLPLDFKRKPEDLVLADGVRSKVGQITHACSLRLTIDQHMEDLTFHLTKLAGWNMIISKPWLRRHDPTIDWSKNSITFLSPHCHENCLPVRPKVTPTTEPLRLKINLISQAAFRVAIKNPELCLCIMALYNKPEDEETTQDTTKKLIPPEYHDYLVLFLEKEARILLPSRYVDHAIPLIDGAKLPFGWMYSISDAELKEVRKWIDENLSKSFIRASSSSAASPILFVKKKDNSLRLCVDYRALNDITVKDQYPLPRIEEILNQIKGYRYFTRLDLQACFIQIHIKEGDEWKTAFRTRYSLFEFLVMPFGLTDAPATAQRFVNDTLHEFLDQFCVCYIDDILMYSKTTKKHRQHVRKVLQKLKEAGLFTKPEKCEFSVQKTAFLGFLISENSIEIDPEKINMVLD